MKKSSFSILMVVAMVAGAFAADLKTERKTAEDLYAAKDYAGSQAAFEKLLKDNPDASAYDVAQINLWISYCYVCQGKGAEALALRQKITNDNPGVNGVGFGALMSYVTSYVADSLNGAGRYAEAQACAEKALKDYPKAAAYPYKIALNENICRALEGQGKITEAQAAYRAVVLDYVWESGAPKEGIGVWAAFDKVNPKLMTTAEYTTFLQDVIKSAKATEANAAFLGRVKSELEKVK